MSKQSIRARFRFAQLGSVAVICALVGAGAGIVGSSAAPSKSKSKSAQSGSKADRDGFHRGPGGPGGPGGHGVQSESVVLNRAGDGFIKVTSNRGTLKSISGNDLTISLGVDGVTYKDATVTVPDGATVVRNDKDAKLSDLKEKDFVDVVSSSEGTFVMAEDSDFRDSEHDRYGPGPGFGRGHGGPPPPPPGM